MCCNSATRDESNMLEANRCAYSVTSVHVKLLTAKAASETTRGMFFNTTLGDMYEAADMIHSGSAAVCAAPGQGSPENQHQCKLSRCIRRMCL